MKTYILALAILMIPLFGKSQKKKEVEKKPFEYVFTISKEVPYTSVKNQASSGTCWSFAGTAFLESEMLRKNSKDTIDLSPMWVVRNAYKDQVEKYVRMHGKLNLSAGGSFYDVLEATKQYGAVPNDIYKGLNYGAENHNHGELDRVIEGFGKGITESKKLSTAWKKALDGILDAYLGNEPSKFNFKGVEYTPESFLKAKNINIDDYISITSFTHHPFYTQFVIEVPDNWSYSQSYNVPLNEMMEIIDQAIQNGFSVAWASDVSEKGFSRDIAIVPVEKKKEIVGTDQAKWTGAKAGAKAEVEERPEEQQITQEMRQQGFDNYETTDDHAMLIVGIVKDQTGKQFYKVKNSWGEGGKYKGFLYASVPFIQYKTMNIVVHKDALPSAIKAKLKY